MPVTLQVNGAMLKLQLEPRVTLLDALRNYAGLTGAKEDCDRATCGACTVLIDGLAVYACMKLALETQGRAITTTEGLARDDKLSQPRVALGCIAPAPHHVKAANDLLEGKVLDDATAPQAADQVHVLS